MTSFLSKKIFELNKKLNLFQVANNQIEIYCGERLIDPELDLRTVKNLIWKKPGSIEFHYRRRRHNQDEYTA